MMMVTVEIILRNHPTLLLPTYRSKVPTLPSVSSMDQLVQRPITTPLLAQPGGGQNLAI